MANPILVEVTRGSLVESIHRGSIAIADAEGNDIEVGKGVHQIRFTQVWVWKKDRWLREAFQATQTTDQPNPK